MKIVESRNSTWFVIRTNPLCEERAYSSLTRAGFGVYIPKYQVERQHRRTKAWITKAHRLMPGYAFVDTNGQPDWFTLRRCDGVREVLGVTDGRGDRMPFAIPSRLVEALMAAQLNMMFDDTREAMRRRGEDAKSVYQPGVSILVTKGPFASFPATVDMVRPNGTVAALVELFGRMTPIELAPEQVELAA